MIARLTAPSLLALALAAAGVASCATSSTATTTLATGPERGRLIAARDCAGCHAIEVGSDSPSISAPPFRDIRVRYDSITLRREFIAIGQGGHYRMPPTQIPPADGDDLIAFIESLGP
jgi:mono/diheme cytochrome c family protein